MAFTTAQEEILEKVIEAFENGKRLTDLPDVGDVDPITLCCEVVGDDGESKKAKLATMLPYVEEQVAYGIRRNISDSSPTCTRIGNMDMHRTCPVQSAMRGCILDDDGNVVEYLPDTDWTGATLDGSKGQVMVELPLHYRKCQLLDDGTMEVWLSYYPLANYELIPRMYVSAYEATVQRSTNKLSSVKSMDADYRGGNNNADRDGTYQTQLGMAATAISSNNFRTYARNRGTAGLNGCGWNSYLYMAHKAITWFFVVEYATLNTQATYNAELTEDGYRQGGLGSGVTTINSNDWSNFNGGYPVVPIGWTDTLGNRTGIVKYTMPEEFEALLIFSVPRYRGIENPFGHIHKWCCDLLCCVHAPEEDGGDGLSPLYACEDPSKFSGTSYADYTFIGNHIRVSSATFISQIIFGTKGETIGCETGGSSSTYYCDRNGSDIAVTADTLRAVFFGGNANYGANAGLFCANSNNAPSITNADYGSRLCFIPA